MTLYLDMDGVIADFFTGFANRFGKDHWKLIQDKERQSSNYKVLTSSTIWTLSILQKVSRLCSLHR